MSAIRDPRFISALARTGQLLSSTGAGLQGDVATVQALAERRARLSQDPGLRALAEANPRAAAALGFPIRKVIPEGPTLPGQPPQLPPVFEAALPPLSPEAALEQRRQRLMSQALQILAPQGQLDPRAARELLGLPVPKLPPGAEVVNKGGFLFGQIPGQGLVPVGPAPKVKPPTDLKSLRVLLQGLGDAPLGASVRAEIAPGVTATFTRTPPPQVTPTQQSNEAALLADLVEKVTGPTHIAGIPIPFTSPAISWNDPAVQAEFDRRAANAGLDIRAVDVTAPDGTFDLEAYQRLTGIGALDQALIPTPSGGLPGL